MHVYMYMYMDTCFQELAGVGIVLAEQSLCPDK
jgi:hypothetical protein